MGNVAGKLTLVRVVQSAKAPSPMVVRLAGREIFIRLGQPAKAP